MFGLKICYRIFMSKLRFIDFRSRDILFFFVTNIHRGGWPNIALGAPKPYPVSSLGGACILHFHLEIFCFMQLLQNTSVRSSQAVANYYSERLLESLRSLVCTRKLHIPSSRTSPHHPSELLLRAQKCKI